MIETSQTVETALFFFVFKQQQLFYVLWAFIGRKVPNEMNETETAIILFKSNKLCIILNRQRFDCQLFSSGCL